MAFAPQAHGTVVKKKATASKSSAHAAHPTASHPTTGHPLTRGVVKSKVRAGKASGKVVRVSGKAGKRGRHLRTAATPPVATWRRGQMEPSPDRYREIQQALASKGYLKSEPSGSWDPQSQDALRRFQADQKLDQSGTITAKSLIALGLGPAKQ